MGEHTYKDKRLAYENSIRVPMIIRYPNLIQRNTTIDELCLNIDLAPTILELAGIKKPDYVQGKSMLNLIRGKKEKDWRKSILFEYYVDDAWTYAGPDQLAVRTNYFKLVDNFIEKDIDELYDLKIEPGDMSNLIYVNKFDKVENELRKELIRLQKKYKYNPDRDWWLRKQTKK